MNFIIIHGVYGNPEENWFPWLKKELEQNGSEVLVPKFPTPIGQSPESWLRIFSEFENKIDGNTVLIGHSLGAVFILRYLEQAKKKIQKNESRHKHAKRLRSRDSSLAINNNKLRTVITPVTISKLPNK